MYKSYGQTQKGSIMELEINIDEMPIQTTNRFWDKVDRSGDCWNWIGSVGQDGYGRMKINGKLIKAHRYAYVLFNGPIPTGFIIHHLCHNTACVNPDHLVPVTKSWHTQHLPVGYHGRNKRTVEVDNANN